MKARHGGLVAALLAVAFATATFADGVVYQNDFATRTSAGAVPYGGWRSVNYVAGQLLANTNWVLATMFDYDDLQDNWIKASNTCKNNAYVDDDDGNYVARLGDDKNKSSSGGKTTGPHVIIRQRIGNTFTNGTVTVTFDMLPPSDWKYHNSDGDNLRNCRFHLGDDAAYWDTPGVANSIFRLGVAYKDSLNGRRVIYRDDNDDETVVSNAVVPSGKWLRFVATVDLDSRKWRFSCYDLDATHPTTHPTIDTPTPATALYSSDDDSPDGLEFYSPSVTSISTIALDGYAILGGNSAVRYDNIRIAHNGTECYVNDFNTRKSRSLAASEADVAYSAKRTTASSMSYTLTNDVLYRVQYNVATNIMTEAGFDGWKRRHTTKAALPIENSSNKYLRFNTSKNGITYGIAAHPIGSSVSSGVLKFRADICAPTNWFGSASVGRYAFFALGGDLYYTAPTATGAAGSPAGQFARVGLTEDGVFHRNSDNSQITNVVTITTGKWYRFIITADLDTGKYGYKVYYKNTQPSLDMADGDEPIVEVDNLTRMNSIDSISCFGIASYGGGSPKFDNFRVWHRPSGSTEEDFDLIYQNSFSSRVTYRKEESMVGTIKSNPTGMDGWTRLGTSEKNVLLSTDGTSNSNLAISFGSGDETYATAVHDLGGEYRGGKMTAQADICAPTSWQEAGGCANIWFGGDLYHEGNLNGTNNYEKMAAFGFGITNTTFAAFCGDRAGGGAWETNGTVTAGHWYRFLVLSENKTSAVLVYDMGTEQPTLVTAVSETPVAGFSNLPFRRNVAISCVGVSAMGVKNPANAAWSHLLPGGTDVRLKIDNIRFAHDPSGISVIVK